MFDGLTPDLAPRLVLAIGGVGVAFVVLVLVLIFLKRRNLPLFIKGGKSREPRLMVLDAAAVDPKRRLVLIRRDDVEHLIMIGGPSDIVIETGITDRAKPAAAASRTAQVPDELVPAQTPVAAPVTEPRPVAPATERRAEAARPAPIVEPERPAPLKAETRPVQAVVQPVARPVGAQANVAERVVPASERLVERPVVERAQVERVKTERRHEERSVSAAGAMLYGDDREQASARPLTVASSPQVQPFVVQAQPNAAVERPVTAEAALDAARQRVLPNPQPAGAGMTTAVSDSEKALAARLESARVDMMRRVQSAQPASQMTSQVAGQTSGPTVTQPIAEPAGQTLHVPAETARARDAEPSDFEKLLEAELDANGVFGQAPQVRSESRITNATATDVVAPPVRVAPPITGATPDVTSEEEVARLLGEIAINRKP